MCIITVTLQIKNLPFLFNTKYNTDDNNNGKVTTYVKMLRTLDKNGKKSINNDFTEKIHLSNMY